MSSNVKTQRAPKIFLINGPPRAGKDTAAEFLTGEFCGRLMKFAGPIKRACTAIYCGGDALEFAKYDSPELKDTPADIFFGKTCREVQIAVSETFLKPFHGDKHVFGRILANDIAARATGEIIFVSDSGFREEAEILVERFGKENVFLFRVYRSGHTFNGDSRNWVDLSDLGVKWIELKNNGDVDEYLQRAKYAVWECLQVAGNPA